MIAFLYAVTLTVLVFFVLFLTIFAILNLYAIHKGSPFVPTNSSKIAVILKKTNLKKGKVFIEPGCGDGRVVKKAVDKYCVKGIGLDINPLLVLKASLGSNKTKFHQIDIYKFDYKDADYVYLFFFPKTLNRLAFKIKKECRSGTKVISHGFKIQGWNAFLTDKIKDKPFSTYFYILK